MADLTAFSTASSALIALTFNSSLLNVDILQKRIVLSNFFDQIVERARIVQQMPTILGQILFEDLGDPVLREF
uniref:Uncharacterized protein n=1 Tax=Romanomermis culicivorax TaxID=13658 RepID=A0A915JZR0_ROMCU